MVINRMTWFRSCDGDADYCRRQKGAECFHPQMECHALSATLTVYMSLSLSLQPSLSLSLTHAAWHKRRGESGGVRLARAGRRWWQGLRTWGAMNMTPELSHCEPMSGSRDM